MDAATILSLQEHPELKEPLAQWFHEKWGIPREAYLESMTECLEKSDPVPQWIGVLSGEKIIAGLGVIENDFHDRRDLTPNVCAVYVEEAYRGQGITGKMLDYICRLMRSRGVDTLYLLTDHDSFYERYGWEFLCMARGEGEDDLSRIYVHRTL